MHSSRFRPAIRFAILLTIMTGAQFALPAQIADSREFRRPSRIPGPKIVSTSGVTGGLPALTGNRIDGTIPIPRRDVVKALKTIFDEWGEPGFRRKFSSNFVRSDRLADSVRVFAPRDARVRVLDAANIQVLQQVIRRGRAPDGEDLLVSRVATTATTQVEFNDRFNARFGNLRGTNDYVIQIFHAIRRKR